MKFETKPLSLSQRIELNDITEFRTDGDEKMVIVKNTFKFNATAAVLGLKTLNGVDVTPENVEQLVNELSSEDITIIAKQVNEEANLSKKKKS
jgi:hypothetical protein